MLINPFSYACMSNKNIATGTQWIIISLFSEAMFIFNIIEFYNHLVNIQKVRKQA